MVVRSVLTGLLGTSFLLVIYFLVTSFVSGISFAQEQFSAFWYFILSLALGFGIQVGLYTYLKSAIKRQANEGKMVAVTGASSTIAMISCCSHYLVNILPIIGIAGFVTIISQYQIQLFWLGLAINLIGIFYIARRIRKL